MAAAVVAAAGLKIAEVDMKKAGSGFEKGKLDAAVKLRGPCIELG